MTRVLFVDDEPRVLEGLRRSLRRKRREWDMVFAEGGEAGIAELDGGPFDVVVSDMRMPRIDGYALLSHARKHQPDAMRIVLTGQTDPSVVQRTMPVAHHFLTKPCDGERVRAVIERVCNMRTFFADEQVHDVVTRAGTLPATPEMYAALTEALQDAAAAAPDIAKIIESDPVLSEKVLRVVNCALSSLPNEMTSLTEATTFLGVDLICSAVLCEEAFRLLAGEGALAPGDVAAIQGHGLLVGCIARRITEDENTQNQAFLASVMQDIGWLILAGSAPELFENYRRRHAGGETGIACERECLGIAHGEMGAYVLGTWGLPLPVVEAVRYHHEPTAVEHDYFDVITAVHVAAALAEDQRPTSVREWLLCEVGMDQPYLEALGVLGRLETWQRIAQEEIARISAKCPDGGTEAA